MRTTAENKDHDIRVRISEGMNLYLEQAAGRVGKSVSEYVRNLVAEDINKTQACFQSNKQSERKRSNFNF